MQLNQITYNVPDVYVNEIAPTPVLNGVPSNLILFVGTATGGPVNSPTTIGSPQQQAAVFGPQTPNKYDLGTAVFNASVIGANNFVCVRVTDGTDTSAECALMDAQIVPQIGAYLTSIYTGSFYNTVTAVISTGAGSTPSAQKYKLTIYQVGGVPEVFDAIDGGANFWQNLVDAVNNGQSVARGKSQLVVASLGTGIGGVTITAPGSYATLPTLTATIGTGAILNPVMSAVSAVVVGGGSGYAVNDTITLDGGTFSTPTVLLVTSETGGAITGVSMQTAGSYTALPSNPVSQASTSGIGTGATFTMGWGIDSVVVANHGTDYTAASVLNISGAGGGAGALQLGSTAAPALASYTLSGGTDGNSGVTTETLIGDDSSTPRTGMYAARGSFASMVVLVDADDPDYYTEQQAFGAQNAMYMIGVEAPGYQDNIAGAIAIKQNSGVDSPAFKLMSGDWVEVNDNVNNLTHFVSPACFVAAVLAVQPPNRSSLNYIMSGIVATQKTAENRIYSDADLSQLQTAGIDVITRPIPASQSAFGCRLGVNTSSNPLTSDDAYTRINNYVAQTILKGMGFAIGQPISSELINTIQNTVAAFLTVLVQNNWINGVQGVQMDSSQQVSGLLICNATYLRQQTLYSLVVNLNAITGLSSIQSSNTQQLAA